MDAPKTLPPDAFTSCALTTAAVIITVEFGTMVMATDQLYVHPAGPCAYSGGPIIITVGIGTTLLTAEFLDIIHCSVRLMLDALLVLRALMDRVLLSISEAGIVLRFASKLMLLVAASDPPG
jgi:hypothetical protein